uniref:Uncharacterized protein n=1 Tax=Caenorhabditis japonica TaxID=281687 RepID=A0A8R1IFT6_CAEJA
MDPSSSIFKPYQDYECWRGDRQTMLKSSIGRQLPYIVNFKKNTCQIFDITLERITHSFTFPESAKLVDVDYFPTEDGHFALDMAEGRRQKTLGLYRGLLEWNHVIAVGCKESTCYLARMTPIEASPGASVPIHDSKKSRISLMGVFITDGNLRYSQDDGCYRDYPISAVYISALALMPRSRTLLVGLSMGGILAAALNPSNQMVFLELRHERLIRELAPLEPEDDPDKFEYFIAAVDRSSRHPVMIQLWRGSFKTLEEVDDSVKYDRPHYAVCLEHKIPYGERWLAVNPIVTERGNLETRRRDDSMMDSMLNSSQSYGCSANRSHVLLAYERRKLTTTTTELPEFVVEAAIFDIDAWYYKRVPGGVSTDGTALRQCAFMSSIKSDINSDQVQDIGILTLVSTDVFRFPSLVSDADQLFYPSALSYDRVFVVGNNQISWMKIQSLQQTIIGTTIHVLLFLWDKYNKTPS